MKHLQHILKQIEITIRAALPISVETWEKLLDLSDWDYQIVQAFITEVNIKIHENDLNFVYKKYDTKDLNKNKPKYDLFIACLKRDQNDLVLTDVANRLVIPKDITHKYFELWGMSVEVARNFAMQKALEFGAKKILFIDDDMIVENTALVKIWETMKITQKITVAANYQRKADYEITAHGRFFDLDSDLEYIKETDICAMGFTLIDLQKLTKLVPAPYFWIFLAPDGLWSMGEDAFFTKNLKEYTGEYPIVDMRPSVLHYDKIWKRLFGQRDKTVTYATNSIKSFNQFDYIRQPPIHPLVNICVPKRLETDHVATDFDRVLNLRGYKTEHTNIFGFNVDEARNQLATNSVKISSIYTFFVDNDVIIPEDGLVKLLEVMESDESIGMVVGDYLLKGKVPHSVHLQLDKTGKVTELNRIKDLKENIFDSNWLVGLGCALIRTSVFRQVQYPYFRCFSPKINKMGIDKTEDGGVNEDAYFTEQLFDNGYKIKIINDLKCIHVDYNSGNMYGYDEFSIEKYACYEWINRFKFVGI